MEAPAPPPAKSKRRWLAVPAVAVAAALGGWFALTQLPPADAAALADGVEAVEPAPGPVKYGQFAKLDGLIVNPAGTDGSRYLMVSVGLEAGHARVLKDITDKEVVVRDAILTVLSAKSVYELTDVAVRDALREELRAAINATLRAGDVDRLYFTQYVLQ